MKTITYKLSSKELIADGHTVRPPDIGIIYRAGKVTTVAGCGKGLWAITVNPLTEEPGKALLFYVNKHGHKMILMKSGTWVNETVVNPRNIRLYTSANKAAAAVYHHRIHEEIHVHVILGTDLS